MKRSQEFLFWKMRRCFKDEFCFLERFSLSVLVVLWNDPSGFTGFGVLGGSNWFCRLWRLPCFWWPWFWWSNRFWQLLAILVTLTTWPSDSDDFGNFGPFSDSSDLSDSIDFDNFNVFENAKTPSNLPNSLYSKFINKIWKKSMKIITF